MYIVHFYDPKEWDLRACGSLRTNNNKKYQSLKYWDDNNNQSIKLIGNLCLFNYATAKYDPLATLHHLYIPRLGGNCGFSENPNSTKDYITLPNGDQISGWSWNGSKQPIMKDDKFYEVTKSFNAWAMVGVTSGGKYIVAKSSAACTQYAMANYIKSKAYEYYKEGIKLLLLEDGGGSVGLYSTKAKTLYAPKKEGVDGRKVCSVMIAERKTTAPKITRTLYYGYTRVNGKSVLACQGDDVRLLQMVIGCVECDGLYGAGTKAQVKVVQKNLGFAKKDQDGIAGPQTLGALGLR